MSFLRLLTSAALLCVFHGAPAIAQLADSCLGAELDSSAMLPLSETSGPAISNAMTMSGAACEELGVDAVVCFEPELSCRADITCSVVDLGTLVSCNLVTGPCSSSPASCSASTLYAQSALLPGVDLTAGTHYCIVAEHDGAGSDAVSVEIVATAGTCGALPVELLSWSVE